MSPLESSIAYEVFGLGPGIDGLRWYSYRSCSQDGVLRMGGLTVHTDGGLDSLRRADTVIVPGWHDTTVAPTEELTDELQRAHRRGARMVSFCTGAFALAHAGVLDGHHATTHWDSAARFRAAFPAIELDPAVLYVDDGQVLTAAGSASAIDLSLHIVRNDHGAEVANAIARDLVVPPHRDGGQAQFVDAPVGVAYDGPDPFGETLDWAILHLDEDLPVTVLAARAAMSPRHFTRRFRAVTGTSPHQWILTQRLGLARRLLETTDESIEVVATLSGFGTSAALRQQFRKHLSTTPNAYRATFDLRRSDAQPTASSA